MGVLLTDVEAHARAYFAGHPCSVAAWLPGPIAQLSPAFRVLIFGPGPRTSHAIYASVGASLFRPGTHREFVLMAPAEHPECIELLAMVAYYHHTQGLDVGHTFPVGRPCLPGAACDHFLVSLPYPFGPALENCSSGGHDVQFLWLLPVHGSEVRFRHAHDLEALESRLEAARIDPVNYSRRAVV